MGKRRGGEEAVCQACAQREQAEGRVGLSVSGTRSLCGVRVEGMDLLSLRMLMGHSSQAVVQRYLALGARRVCQ